ncbi:MAG TPA: Stf0 family sulfotransferase [Ktedonobacteraceae bacterium]|nr:Stf0 family sulfotransferase [Ktedonobacteraceae bacterium]
MQPHTSYLVCATQRSESTLLCEALTNTQRAGHPAEYFEALRASGLPTRPKEYFEDIEDNEINRILGNYSRIDQKLPQRFTNYENYLNEVLEKGTTSNGVFGAKMMWGYLGDFVDSVRQIHRYRELAVPHILPAIFPNLHYIFVTRSDKVRQAISLWKAIQTQTWRVDGHKDPSNSTGQLRHSDPELVFNFAAIDHLVQRITRHDAAWQDYFSCLGIQPFTVVYEELVDAYEETATAILRYLHIPVPEHLPFAPRTMQKQSNGLSEQWVERYHAIKQEQEEQPD